jgi:hypothetical protein
MLGGLMVAAMNTRLELGSGHDARTGQVIKAVHLQGVSLVIASNTAK